MSSASHASRGFSFGRFGTRMDCLEVACAGGITMVGFIMHVFQMPVTGWLTHLIHLSGQERTRV